MKRHTRVERSDTLGRWPHREYSPEGAEETQHSDRHFPAVGPREHSRALTIPETLQPLQGWEVIWLLPQGIASLNPGLYSFAPSGHVDTARNITKVIVRL